MYVHTGYCCVHFVHRPLCSTHKVFQQDVADWYPKTNQISIPKLPTFLVVMFSCQSDMAKKEEKQNGGILHAYNNTHFSHSMKKSKKRIIYK